MMPPPMAAQMPSLSPATRMAGPPIHPAINTAPGQGQVISFSFFFFLSKPAIGSIFMPMSASLLVSPPLVRSCTVAVEDTADTLEARLEAGEGLRLLTLSKLPVTMASSILSAESIEA